jgi:repressor LexA
MIGEEHPQKVKHHMEQLVKKNRIQIDPVSNKISITSQGVTQAGFILVPIMGSASCGVATSIAEENIEGMLMLSPSLVNFRYTNSLIALRAVGSSMNKARVRGMKTIEDGDYVIVNTAERTPINGDYVLSIIDGLANIKKFINNVDTTGQIVLISESYKELPPIYIHPDDMDSYIVNGKVVDVIKRPHIQEPEAASMV